MLYDQDTVSSHLAFSVSLRWPDTPDTINHYLCMLASEKGLALHTIAAYRRDLAWWSSFVREHGVQEVTLDHHADFIHFLQSTHQLSARSVARILSGVRGCFRFLVSQATWSTDPWMTARHQRYPKPTPHPLTEEEMRALLHTVHQDTSPEGLRLTALLELLYATGMRISELLALPLIPLENTSIHPIRITGKGGHERFVFFTPQACKAVSRYMTVRPVFTCGARSEKFLFPSRSTQGHITRQRVGQCLTQAAMTAGLGHRGVSPHGIRHAFATHLLHRGVDLVTLKELLGHRDISTTQLYTHVGSHQWAQILAQHHPLARAP